MQIYYITKMNDSSNQQIAETKPLRVEEAEDFDFMITCSSQATSRSGLRFLPSFIIMCPLFVRIRVESILRLDNGIPIITIKRQPDCIGCLFHA